MSTTFECIDCKQIILFDPLESGSEGGKPIDSWCICVDRETNKSKVVPGRKHVYHNKNATFIPEYLKNNLAIK